MSPLSGHYRPPANNFRRFVKSLKEAGVDMSHVSISKSYAILVGLEAYGNFCKGKKKTKRAAYKTTNKVIDKALPGGTPHLHKSKEDENAKEQYQIDKPTHYSADGTADIGKNEKSDKQSKKQEKKKGDKNNFTARCMRKCKCVLGGCFKAGGSEHTTLTTGPSAHQTEGAEDGNRG